MAWANPQIDVTFIDDASGDTVGVTRMPAKDLPESFEHSTTLHLADQDWSVVDAQPATRVEYRKSRSLVMRLRRIEKMDPRKILYSLPSICDQLPPLSNRPLSGHEFTLATDDWRQIELISSQHADVVDAELAQIQLIHETAAVGVGWQEIHVRSNPSHPVGVDLSVTDLANALDSSTKPARVAFRDAPSPIVDGYALTTSDGLSVYGVAPNGTVRVIGLGQSPGLSPDSPAVQPLKTLASDKALDLVDWCRCLRAEADDPTFASLLIGPASHPLTGFD